MPKRETLKSNHARNASAPCHHWEEPGGADSGHEPKMAVARDISTVMAQ